MVLIDQGKSVLFEYQHPLAAYPYIPFVFHEIYPLDDLDIYWQLVMGDRLSFIIDHRLESVDAFNAILPIIIGFHIFTELSTFYALEGYSGASGFFFHCPCVIVLNLKQNSMARRHALFLGRHALFDSAMPFSLAPCHQNVPLIKIFTC